MKRVALTGGIGTGKSTVADFFTDCGAALVDADAIVHQLYANDETLRAAIAREFGSKFITDNGAVNREKLGIFIFHDPKARQRLEAIVHPRVIAQMREQGQQYAEADKALCLFDIPLLFEANLPFAFDATIVVSCSPAEQLERVQKRYEWNREAAEARIKSQMPLDDKVRRADYVIDTDGPLEKTRQQVDALYQTLIAS